MHACLQLLEISLAQNGGEESVAAFSDESGIL